METTNQDDDYFQITWPARPYECPGVCQWADGQSEPDDDGDRPKRYLDEVEEDAARGCHKCMLIYLSCRDFKKIMHGRVEVFCSSANPGVIIFGSHHDYSTMSYVIHIYIQLGTPQPAWDYIKPVRAAMVMRREEYGPLLDSWTKECNTRHTGCVAKNPKLPRRVLDVGSKSKPCLSLHCSSEEEVGQYVALTYCWGTSHTPKTFGSNLAEHQHNINFDTLPRTLQDAVVVTRDVGIQYLWIDSLCIVQDDNTDWQAESSKMAAYYTNAYLVIAAAQADDSTQGFLDATEDHSHFTNHPSTEIGHIKNPDSSISRIYRRRLETFSWAVRHTAPLIESPLNTRAWALQENLLAKRIVHFTKGEMLWECVEGVKCECMETENVNSITKQNAGVMRKTQLLWLRYANESPSLHELWLGLLHHYSTLDLSYESDLLPALSGLAKLWESRGAGKYLAGFWEDYILESITWETTGTRAHRRSKEYRAPSWSPFSLEDTDRYGHNRRKHVSFHHPGILKTSMRVHAVVLDAGVITAGEDPTGKVESGFLQLRGLVSRVNLQDPSGNNTRTRTQLGGRSVTVDFDIEMDLSIGLALTLILIGYSEHSYCVALALKPWRDPQSYERVGILRTYGGVSNQLLAGAEEIITIV